MRRSTAFALVTFAFTVTMLGTTMPTPLYPLYQDQFRFGNLMFTVIYATYAAGVIAALLLFGSLSDQIGRRRVLLLGLRLSAASALAFLVADNVVTLLAGRAMSGLGAGIITGTATAALVDLVPGNRPGRASLVAAAANMGGLGLGPLLAGSLAQFAPEPSRLCFLVNLALIAAALIGIEVMPEPRRFETKVRLRPQRLRIPAEIRSTFVRAAVPGFAGFAVLGLFTAISGALLAIVVQQTNYFLSGLLAFVGFAASLVGQAISTTMSERRGLLSGCAVLVVAMALVATSLAVASLPLLVAAAVAAGIGQGTSFRAGLAMVTASSPTGQRAAVASSYFVTVYVALSIPVIGVGAGAQSFGWTRSAIVFAAVVGLFPLAAFVGLARRERPRPLRALPSRSPRQLASTPPDPRSPQSRLPGMPLRPPAQRPQPHPPLPMPLRPAPELAALAQLTPPQPQLTPPHPQLMPPQPQLAAAQPQVAMLLPPAVFQPSATFHPPAVFQPSAVFQPLAMVQPPPTSQPEPRVVPPLELPATPHRPVEAPQLELPPPWHLPPTPPDQAPPPRLPHPWRLPPRQRPDPG
jgi:MFS family permease